MFQKTLLIADDHEVFRHGLRELLSTQFEVVAEAREGGEAVEKAIAHRPDVVVMDIRMPGMNGIEAARDIKARLPKTGVVIISATDDDQHIFDAIEAGVSGYVAKDDTAQSMLTAVQHAVEGRAYLPPLIAKRVMARVAGAMNGRKELSSSNGSTPLSARELSVLRLMAEGKRNREIATELCISERTVGNHISNIYNKLCICDRAQAIVYAIKKGIIR
ncbi:MAG: response regulator, partial [Chloroflexota bacterium]